MYNGDAVDTTGMSVTTLHLVFTLPALIFSPIGEESFSRGTMQRTFEEFRSTKAAMLLQALAFGLIHVFHHGISVSGGEMVFLPVSGIVWFDVRRRRPVRAGATS
ncbi:MAG: CPBP family intramembrane glutamic endopeptidase [Acidimicrobiia bacterium]